MQTQPPRAVERFLVALDSGIWAAIARFALGLAIPPLFHARMGANESVYTFLGLFLAVLIGLRVGPTILRLVLPFSPEVKAIWAERRSLAKRYDSYQWQKLFWIGLGLLAYIIIARETGMGELAAATFCLIGGATGLGVWRRTRAAQNSPTR